MFKTLPDIDWDPEEKQELLERVLRFNDTQIEELFEKVGITYAVPMEEVIKEIRKNKQDSVELDVLLSEADSKEDLLKWVTYFEENSSS